jgi:hypothetical protein
MNFTRLLALVFIIFAATAAAQSTIRPATVMSDISELILSVGEAVSSVWTDIIEVGRSTLLLPTIGKELILTIIAKLDLYLNNRQTKHHDPSSGNNGTHPISVQLVKHISVQHMLHSFSVDLKDQLEGLRVQSNPLSPEQETLYCFIAGPFAEEKEKASEQERSTRDMRSLIEFLFRRIFYICYLVMYYIYCEKMTSKIDEEILYTETVFRCGKRQLRKVIVDFSIERITENDLTDYTFENLARNEMNDFDLPMDVYASQVSGEQRKEELILLRAKLAEQASDLKAKKASYFLPGRPRACTKRQSFKIRQRGINVLLDHNPRYYSYN